MNLKICLQNVHLIHHHRIVDLLQDELINDNPAEKQETVNGVIVEIGKVERNRYTYIYLYGKYKQIHGFNEYHRRKYVTF